MNRTVSLALRCCLFAGIAILAVGLAFSEHEYGGHIMWAGILVLIASPFAGVLAAYASLMAEKDWKWIRVATALTVLILIFLAVSLLRN